MTKQPAPDIRFLALLGFVLLALCAGYSALVLYSTTWPAARGLDVIFPFYKWRTQPFSLAGFERLRLGLGLTALAAAAGAGGLLASACTRREASRLRQEAGATLRGLWRGVAALPPPAQRLALALLTLLTGARVYFSLANPEYDDAVSYEVFVSKGWLATSAYYPIPNNHVFSNTISVLFYQLHPGFWWSMRLPVLLISTGATVFLFAGLVRRSSFRVAAVAVGLFSGLQLSLYHAGVGRGYWLMILLAGIVFFATLELAQPRGRHRAAWAALLAAGTLGCYTVPPFVYVLASAFSYLGLVALGRRQWAGLGRLVALGGVIGLGSVLLYAPLLLVSGFDALTGNGYVARLPAPAFWQQLPAYLWHTEGFLAGQRTLGAFITIPVLAVAAGLLARARAGQLAPALARQLGRLAAPALWFAGLPYALIVVQRVFPPERVMLYKAFFFFIVLGLVVDWLLRRPGALRQGWLRPALLGVAGLFLGYEAYSVVRVNPAARGTNAAYRAGLYWLAGQPAGPVLVPEPTHNLFLRFYAHSQRRERRWQIDAVQQPATRYTYVVAFPARRGYFQPEFPFPPAYHNAEVDIYRVPAGYSFRSEDWKH